MQEDKKTTKQQSFVGTHETDTMTNATSITTDFMYIVRKYRMVHIFFTETCNFKICIELN